MTLAADLKLRFGTARPPARLYLPSPSTVAAGWSLVVWLTVRGSGEILCRELSTAGAAVVLELGMFAGASGDGYEMAVLGWAAEHAPELGADAGHLVVAGQGAGAARAARLAIDVRDAGWPVLRRQVLVRPAFTEPRRLAAHVAGTAPATIVTAGPRGDDGRFYAAALREAGVAVQELVSDGRRRPPLAELARALR